MKGFLLRILLLVGVSFGAAAGYVAAKGLRWIPSEQEIAAWQRTQDQHQTIRSQTGIELPEFRELLSQGVIVVDARARAEFEKGHLLVDLEPPVLNVPVDAVDAAQINRLMAAQQQTGFPIVLYCTSRTCTYAEELYTALAPYGFMDMKIYLDGWEGIQTAGLPTTTGPDTWTGFAPTTSDVGATLGVANSDTVLVEISR